MQATDCSFFAFQAKDTFNIPFKTVSAMERAFMDKDFVRQLTALITKEASRVSKNARLAVVLVWTVLSKSLVERHHWGGYHG